MTNRSIIYMELHKPNNKLVSVVGAVLVHGQATSIHEFIRLTMVWTWGNPPPSPLYCFLSLATRVAPKCHFALGLPNRESWNSQNWVFYNFLCKFLIETRFKAKLYPSLKIFQQYMTCNLHASKSRWFLTFNGHDLNWHFDFWPFFGHNLCSKYSNGSCKPILDI